MTNSLHRVPNNTVSKDGNNGCISGSVRILCALAIIMMMYMLVSKSNQKNNPQRILPKEIRHNVDTCSKITDTFNIKTR